VSRADNPFSIGQTEVLAKAADGQTVISVKGRAVSLLGEGRTAALDRLDGRAT